jgi:UDP-perosamine 4-acetyltransferase
MSKTWLILGAGGHARVLLSLLRRSGVSVAGFVASAGLVPSEGLPILGDDDWLSTRAADRYQLANGVGSIGVTDARRKLFTRFDSAGFQFPTLIDPDACVDDDVQLGAATQILRCAVVQPGVRIGRNCIINTGAIIDHECSIEDHVHIAPGSTLSGATQVGEGTHIGTAAVVRQGIRIGANCVIGAGSVVVSDIADGRKAWGVPARCRD